MHLYGTTLVDVTDDQPVDDFQLPSSSLVPCTKDVTFSFVEPGHRYVAVVRGYDRTDLDEQRAGSPNAVDESDRVVEPRWTTQCGRAPLDLEQLGAGGQGGAESGEPTGSAGAGGDSGKFDVEGVTSNTTYTVFASYCAPLIDRGPPMPSTVRVAPADAGGDFICGTGPGEIFEFRVEPLGSAADAQRIGCDKTARFSHLTPGIDLSFEVGGYAQGSSTPDWQTECRARPEKGTTVDADCDPLREVRP